MYCRFSVIIGKVYICSIRNYFPHHIWCTLIPELIIKGGNPLPRFNVGSGGGAYSEPWGVRALTIIDYGLEAVRQLLIFIPHPLFAHFCRDMYVKRVGVIKYKCSF